MSYGLLSQELAGYLPGLSGYLAEDWIRRAWRKVRDARTWSFLITDDAFVCPPQVTSGAFNITQYAITATANATASAALTTAISSQVPYTDLQLRFQGSGSTSEVYNVVSVNTSVPTALVFTLDRAVMEATNATQQYLAYRAYVTAPVADFLRWISVVDMVNGLPVRLDYSSVEFDARDPQRQCLGQAYFMGYYKASSDTPPRPIYELWPGPTSGQTFYVRYRRRGVDFSLPPDVQPDLIPDDLIVQAALGFYAYQFAMANVGHFPAMKGVNWMQLIADAKKTYFLILQDAKRQDDNQVLQSVFNRGHGLRDRGGVGFPADANFAQSHLVSL